jgi:hypothetical protein
MATLQRPIVEDERPERAPLPPAVKAELRRLWKELLLAAYLADQDDKNEAT